MKNVKAVLFDAGYTLLAPAVEEWFLPPRLFDFVDREKFRGLDPALYRRAYQAGYDYLDLIHDRVKTEEAEEEQFFGFYKAFSREVPQLEMSDGICLELAKDHTYNDDKFVFYDDVRPALERLSQKYDLGVLSDTWPSLHRIFKNYGIRDQFKAFVLSCDLGVFKPDAKMYRAAIDALDVRPDEIVFVDDVLKNLEGAEKAGIRPVQILRKEFPTGKYPVVRDLRELEALLEN